MDAGSGGGSQVPEGQRIAQQPPLKVFVQTTRHGERSFKTLTRVAVVAAVASGIMAGSQLIGSRGWCHATRPGEQCHLHVQPADDLLVVVAGPRRRGDDLPPRRERPAQATR